MASDREFRGEESHDAESVTRERVRAVLESRGFAVVDDARTQNGQTIVAELPGGGLATMRVRLSWRTGGSRDAAVQLRSDSPGGDQEGSLRRQFDGARERGFTHTLFVQRVEDRIVRVALVPIADVVPIWARQRAVYHDLILRGLNGRRHANPAENGDSPTLWLMDDRPPGTGAAAAAVLWDHPGVVDVTALPRVDRGAGFGRAAENRLVEEAATAAVRQWYESDGWDVHSRERDCCGFDLECTRQGAVENVEVKGVRGGDQVFFITRGEVAQARADPAFVLAVVTSALTDRPVLTRYPSEEFLERFELTPVQYQARLRP
jgi:hypothetical protein